MSRLAVGVAVVALLLADGCSGDTVKGDDPSTAHRPSLLSTPGDTGTSHGGRTSVPAVRRRVPTAQDVQLIRRFVAFAITPTSDTAARVPFGTSLRLGLGPVLRTRLSEAQVAHSDQWALRATAFRGYTGPFNALTLIRRHARRTKPGAVGVRDGPFRISLGAHPHCAGGAVPPPEGLEHLRRVSVQPSSDSYDSCLTWFTVDLFLDKEGMITAATLDVWEP